MQFLGEGLAFYGEYFLSDLPTVLAKNRGESGELNGLMVEEMRENKREDE